MNIRRATEKDLDELNNVITEAVMQWELPDRVKRLSLSSFHYDVLDLQHMDMQLAINNKQSIIGIVAWETTDDPDEMLLHGIFVRPNEQRKGAGELLLQTAEQGVSASMAKSILVKPHKEAINFFRKMGFERVIANTENQYENLMRKPLSSISRIRK